MTDQHDHPHSALINAVVLIVGALLIVSRALPRLLEPEGLRQAG